MILSNGNKRGLMLFLLVMAVFQQTGYNWSYNKVFGALKIPGINSSINQTHLVS